jgi:hypothetical protein
MTNLFIILHNKINKYIIAVFIYNYFEIVKYIIYFILR